MAAGPAVVDGLTHRRCGVGDVRLMVWMSRCEYDTEVVALLSKVGA